MLCNPADKNVMTYGAQAPSIKWSLSAGRSCLGIWGLHIETMMFFILKNWPVASLLNSLRRVLYFGWLADLCLFVLKFGHLCFYQISWSNWIPLLKLMSLVNICLCLKGELGDLGVTILGLRTENAHGWKPVPAQFLRLKILTYYSRSVCQFTAMNNYCDYYYFCTLANLEYYLFNMDRFCRARPSCCAQRACALFY